MKNTESVHAYYDRNKATVLIRKILHRARSRGSMNDKKMQQSKNGYNTWVKSAFKRANRAVTGKTNVKLTSGLCLSANFDPWCGTEQQDDVFTSRLLKIEFTVKPLAPETLAGRELYSE